MKPKSARTLTGFRLSKTQESNDDANNKIRRRGGAHRENQQRVWSVERTDSRHPGKNKSVRRRDRRPSVDSYRYRTMQKRKSVWRAGRAWILHAKPVAGVHNDDGLERHGIVQHRTYIGKASSISL